MKIEILGLLLNFQGISHWFLLSQVVELLGAFKALRRNETVASWEIWDIMDEDFLKPFMNNKTIRGFEFLEKAEAVSVTLFCQKFIDCQRGTPLRLSFCFSQ